MNSSPKITQTESILLVGKRIHTSLYENKTKELWQTFGPLRRKVKHQINSDSYSVEIYDSSLKMKNFTPDTKFQKWAAVAVTKFEDIPASLETLIIPAGEYAVFTFKGLQSDYSDFANFIFMQWLPSSKFELDNRPHFEIMSDTYFGPMNPHSEEEIWVPIK
ncbi:MAG: hypothetical protein BalsKO_16670 [Balneolaceae bacterium]